MNLEKLLQLAYDGALWRWTYAKENYEHNPSKLNKHALDEKWADMKDVTELRAEYESDGEDAFCDTAKYLDHVRTQYEEQMKRFASVWKTAENDAKYMVWVNPFDESVKPSRKSYSTLGEATDSYMSFKYQIKMGVINAKASLYKKRDGRLYQLEVVTSENSESKQPLGYAIHVVHNNGKIQDLNFESIKAVEATVEMLKFYLKSELIETIVVFKKITPAHYETIKIIRREDV